MAREKIKFTNVIKTLNPITIVNFSKNVKTYLELKFFLFLSYNYYITKGFLHSVLNVLSTPYYREHGLNSQQEAYNFTLSRLPWSMKGFIGVISDLIPIFGYSKTSYLFIYTILATIASVIIIVTPDDILFSIWQLPGAIIFFMHLQGSAGDLLTEGKYVEKMKEHPESKGDIVTYVWWCQMFGGFFPTLFIPILAETMNMRWMFILVLFLVAGMLPLLMKGCMTNDKVPSHMNNKFNVEKFKINWKLMIVGVLLGSLALALALLFAAPYEVILAVALIGSFLACILVVFAMPAIIAKAVIYLFISTATYGGDGSSTTYWSLSSEECLPDGPHLSYVDLLTWGGLAANIASLIGVWIYAVVISKLPLRTMFWTTTVFRILSGTLTIFWVLRWNLAIGISDYVFYIFGTTVIPQILYLMDFMPTNILIAKLCPKNVEVTVYAIMAGFSNFGQNVAAYYGITLSQVFGIDSSVCNFENLYMLLILVSLILPSIQIPCVFFLIPNGYIEDDFLGESTPTTENKYIQSLEDVETKA